VIGEITRVQTFLDRTILFPSDPPHFMPRRAHQQVIGLMLLELAPAKFPTPVKATAEHALIHGCKRAPLDLESVDLEGILAELLRAIVAV
jgi:hypothetical protein